jgi:hypothetical protein
MGYVVSQLRVTVTLFLALSLSSSFSLSPRLVHRTWNYLHTNIRLTLHHYLSTCGQLRPTTIYSIGTTSLRVASFCDAILRPTKPQSSPNIFSSAFSLSKEDGPAPFPSTSIADHLVYLGISRSSQTIPLPKSPSLSHDSLPPTPLLAPRSGVFLIGQQLCTSSSRGCKGTDHGDL